MKTSVKKNNRYKVLPCTFCFYVFIFLLLFAFIVPWLSGIALVSGEKWYNHVPLEGRAQLRSIQRRLSRGEAEEMQAIFPEGWLFAYSFYGFSLVNMSLCEPDDVQLREMACEEILAMLPILEGPVSKEVFYPCVWCKPKGGVILAGQCNLLRAGYMMLGGRDESLAKRFHADSEELYNAFMESSVGSIESYPGLIWPVDNLCALDSLRLHDLLFGTNYGMAGQRWIGWMQEHLDEESGMMVAQISEDGKVLEEPRGCALSWSLAWMGNISPDFARSQYEKYRRGWFKDMLCFRGVREWKVGAELKVDYDTGPIAWDIGAAASAFGIAAAKANGDVDSFQNMLRGAEILSFASWNPAGEKSILFGQVLLCDVLSLWGKTVRPWDREITVDIPTASQGVLCFWIVWSIIAIVGLGPLLLFGRFLVGRFLLIIVSDRPRSKSRTVILFFQITVFLVWLFWLEFVWVAALALIGISAVIERRLFNRHVKSLESEGSGSIGGEGK